MKLDIKYLKKNQIKFTFDDDKKIHVGGSLDLRGTGITALPEGLTVGGYLYLTGTGITALPEGLTVGGSLYLSGTGITKKEYSCDVSLALKNKKITNSDGIWGCIISQKGTLAKVKLFGKKEVSFIASADDERVCAHGKTAADAYAELAFKIADKGDLSDLYNMPLDTVKTPKEWGFIYRRVTGACKLGTDSFMSTKVKKESYTLAEIIEETKDAFGHDRFKETVINSNGC